MGEAMPDQDQEQTFKPPYVSFTMLQNLLERMRTEGTPARVDRGYLGNASGTAKAQLLAAAKGLGLLDDQLRPTDTLQLLVEQPQNRPPVIEGLIRQHYAPILELGNNATQQQLEEAFREQFNISGSTVRKAIAFYLAAAKFAKIELSPHFTAPRIGTTTSGARRRRRTGAGAADTPPSSTDSFAALRTKYVEALLTKFEQSNGEVDAELADRIERLVGFGSETEPQT
jgi:hypothetical protein